MSATASWKLLTILSDVPSAMVLVDALRADRIEARVVSDANVLGQAAPCRIFVQAAHLHRAHWALAQRRFSDEELNWLSTGEIPAQGIPQA